MSWSTLLQAAVAKGIVPKDALGAPDPAVPHPWPLVLLSFLGALLAAIPVIGFFGLFIGDALMSHGVAAYLAGAVLVGVVWVMLCGISLPLFVENLALTVLLAGLGLLYYAILRDMHDWGFAPCALITGGLALSIPVRWLQSLLAAIAAGTVLCLFWRLFHWSSLPSLVIMVLLWLGGLRYQRYLLSIPGQVRRAISLEWMLGGWIMLVLVAALDLPTVGGSYYGSTERIPFWVVRGLGIAASVGGGAWSLRQWRALRGVCGIGVLLVLAGLAWFMPSLGVVSLIGLVLLTSMRSVQAGASALVAAWIIGRFYYVLQWDLLTKAKILLLAGLILAALAWWARRHHTEVRSSPKNESGRMPVVLTILGTLVTLLVVNAAIWQKEKVIAKGKPVFVKLAPVDPRSLMQGDYMALNFEMSPTLRSDLSDLPRMQRPKAIGPIDTNGVTQLEHLGDVAKPGETLIELSPGKRGWVVVTDAWFFKEGDGGRWAKARYGEFRVMPDGKALLVGMADEQLQPIHP